MKLKIILITFLVVAINYSQSGIITGIVKDATTNESLIGVNIIVNELENMGAATNIDGKFKIISPVGSYSIKVSLIGFQSVVKTDIIVKSNSELYVEVFLVETTLEFDEIKVTADYFDKAIIENNLSTIALGVEEVRRSPGAMGDFQRILQSMPGVSFSNDQTNELLVRGGSPNENLTVFDGMELHSTNHYPNEFNSGGPINMINTDLIQDIQFSTGGFISKYGDKLSSVMHINTRDGSRIVPFTGELNFNMAGVGAILEGEINDGKGSWLVSFRKSYIDLIASGFGLTAIPKYYDGQFKIAYDLSRDHKLSWSGIYGNDKILFDGDSDEKYSEKAGVIDSVDVQGIDLKQEQWATGITLKSFWSKKMFSEILIYGNNYHNNINVKNDYQQRIFDENGKIKSTNFISSRKVFNILSDNSELAIKAELNYNISKTNKLEFGVSHKFGGYKSNTFVDADTVRYDLNNDGIFDRVVVLPSSEFETNLKLFENNESYVYVNNNLKFLKGRLTLNLGIRYDYFSYSEKGNVSPRISASYYLIPAITSLSFAYGEYYQTQSYPTYGDRFNTNENQFLKNSHSRHLVGSIEHILDDGLKINLEGYYKTYSDLPVQESFIHSNDRTFRSEKYLNIGTKEVYGIDLLIQQKLVKDIYGTLSFSRMWSSVDDLRIDYEGETYSSDYDFPYVLTAVLGKRFSNLRTDLDEMPFYLKYPSYILPFSDDMEISVRWRYASGKPYTPQKYVTYEQHRVGGSGWTEGGWSNSDEINSERYDAYHRLDIAFNSRYNFDTWNLIFTLSIQNIYNRNNIASFQYNSDGTFDKISQFSLLPVAGLEIEF
ncbi:MAG: TonB-dependent receptor [Ignavibacteriae bacterium]|nr:TonB-dependent receptor [Ignavibacteriota bacterium]